MSHQRIKIGIIGVGNCASALIQGIEYYKHQNKHQTDASGLMHWELGGYYPGDIEIVTAFDIDARKVNLDIADAIFAPPNCTYQISASVPILGVNVAMGRILDGVSPHMQKQSESHTFVPSHQPEASQTEIVEILKRTGTEVLINYLPVGSQQATEFYAECALAAGVGFINCIPVFIASHLNWAQRFQDRNIPIIGDDIKSQVGATIVHRVLADLFKKRGVSIDRTYQINTGGNTDFLNMLNRDRLASKKKSKTEAVQAALDIRLDDGNIHVGPSDYIPWQKDNKIAFIRLEGKGFGNAPMNLELRLSVEDSPNSAGVVIDAIRCCKLALDRKIGGILEVPSAYFMKSPPLQLEDDRACQLLEVFINS